MGGRHNNRGFRGVSSCWLALLLVFSEPLAVGSEALAQEKEGLSIRVLEGNNRVIEKDGKLELLVEIRDGNGLVPGAEVTFVAPEYGPGILFAGNLNRLTVTTDARGRAVSGPTRSIGGQGPFTVGIVALAQTSSATTTAQAANQTTSPPDSTGKKKSKKLLWILIAGGAAGGVAFAAMGKSGSNSGGTPIVSTPSTTITAGSPTVGAPQ